MTGVLERVVAAWLSETDERAFQAPFAALLAKRGATVKYYSAHSTVELGRDLVTLEPSGRLVAYQLKVGNVSIGQWRTEIAGEITDACEGVIHLPGQRSRIPSKVVLVTTGTCSDPVIQAIEEKSRNNRLRRLPAVELIQRDELFGEITRSFETFLPASVRSLELLLRVYLADPRGPAECLRLERFLEEALVDENLVKDRAIRRAALNLVIATAFAASRFEANSNWIGVMQTWTVAATTLVRLSKKRRWREELWISALDICREAIEQAGEGLLQELRPMTNLIQSQGPDEFFLFRPRSIVILGFAGAVLNSRALGGRQHEGDARHLVELALASTPFAPWGEGAWNFLLNLAIAVRGSQVGSILGLALVSRWLQSLCQPDLSTQPSPYITPDEMFEEIDDTEVRRERVPVAYSLGATLHFLTRRLWRREIGKQWQTISRYSILQVEPRVKVDILRWHIEEGAVVQTALPLQQSWKQLRDHASEGHLPTFPNRARWLLPYFMVTYPHRIVTEFSDYLDIATTPTRVK